MDREESRPGAPPKPAVDCRQKVNTFVAGALLSRPEVDLNTYYVLALNEEPRSRWSIRSSATAAASC